MHIIALYSVMLNRIEGFKQCKRNNTHRVAVIIVYGTKEAGCEVMLKTCTRFTRWGNTTHHKWSFSWISWVPPGECQGSTTIRPQLLPSKFFTIHYSSCHLMQLKPRNKEIKYGKHSERYIVQNYYQSPSKNIQRYMLFNMDKSSVTL